MRGHTANGEGFAVGKKEGEEKLNCKDGWRRRVLTPARCSLRGQSRAKPPELPNGAFTAAGRVK